MASDDHDSHLAYVISPAQLPRALRILTEVLGVIVTIQGPDFDGSWSATATTSSNDWLNDTDGATREKAIQRLNKVIRKMAMNILRDEYTFER